MRNESRTPEQQIERLAYKRARAKMGVFLHAGIYLVVNLVLAALSVWFGRHWAIFPALGWGLGLAIHAFIVFVVGGSGGLQERLVAHERNRLSLQRDPW